MTKKTQTTAGPNRYLGLLKWYTGKDERYWFKRVGLLIRKHSFRGDDPVHDSVHPDRWLKDLTAEVLKHCPGAPCYDPRRPVAGRKQLMAHRTYYCQETMRIVVDQSVDSKHFPDQAWDDPFAPNAKNGTYR